MHQTFQDYVLIFMNYIVKKPSQMLNIRIDMTIQETQTY